MAAAPPRPPPPNKETVVERMGDGGERLSRERRSAFDNHILTVCRSTLSTCHRRRRSQRSLQSHSFMMSVISVDNILLSTQRCS